MPIDDWQEVPINDWEEIPISAPDDRRVTSFRQDTAPSLLDNLSYKSKQTQAAESTVSLVKKESSMKVEVPKSWVQGEEPSLYQKFTRLFDDPEKESAKCVQALVDSNAYNITPSQAYDIGTLKTSRIRQAVKAGIASSTPGIIYNNKIPDFEPLGTYEEIAMGFSSALANLPVYAAGYAIGSAGGASPITGMGGSFALEAGLRKVYTDKIMKGEVVSFGDFVERLTGAIKETAKGEITGSLTSAAGAAVPARLQFLTEVGTMTTVGSLLEGHIPGARDFSQSLATMGLLHVVGIAPDIAKRKMFDLYIKNNKHPVEVGNEVNKQLQEYDIRPITDILKDLDPLSVKKGEDGVYRYEPVRKFEKSKIPEFARDGKVFQEPTGETRPIAEINREIEALNRNKSIDNAFKRQELERLEEERRLANIGSPLITPKDYTGEGSKVNYRTPEQILKDIEAHRDAISEGNPGDKASHDEAIKELFIKDPDKAIKEWNDTQKVEAVTNILSEIEKESTKQDVPLQPSSSTTIETSAKKRWKPRSVEEMLKDINTSLGQKGAVGDIKTEEAQRQARKRLREDVRKFSEAAKEAGVELAEFLKQVGFNPDDIKKLLELAPVKEIKSSMAVSTDNDPIIKQRNLGTKKTPRYAPALKESDRTGMKNMPEIETGVFGDMTVNPIYTFEQLGKWAMDKFYWPMVEAHDRAKRQYLVIEKEIKQIKATLPKESAKRIGIYATSVQEKGDIKLRHMGIKEVPKLTKEEMSAYNKIRNHYKDLYNQLQEARLAAGKELFPPTEDYFTFIHELNFLEKLGLNPILGKKETLNKAIEADVAKNIHMKATRFGFAKKRTNALYNLNLDAFNVFLRYTDSATQHIQKSPEIARMRELLLRFPVKENEAKGFKLMEHSPNTHGIITEWLDYQAGQHPYTRLAKAPIIEKTLKAMNRNLSFAILSGSIRSTLIQPSALHSTTVEIGTKYLRKGIADLFDSDRVAFAVKESKHLLSREYDVNIAEATKGLLEKSHRLRQKVGELGLEPLKYLDLKTATATWLGAYDKAIEVSKMSHAEAVRYADKVTIQTQASALPMDIAPIQRTVLGKTLTIFQTFTINHWNYILNNVLDARDINELSKKEVSKKIATYITAGVLINILYEDILGVNSPLPTPVNAGLSALENGDDVLGVSKEIGKELMQLVPFGGGARYGSSPFGATVDLIENISKHGLTPSNMAKVAGVPGTQQIKRANEANTWQEVIGGKLK